MTIYIMRHAATTADTNGRVLGRVDEPILASELEALRSKAKDLEKEGIDLVISSPLLRASRQLNQLLNY